MRRVMLLAAFLSMFMHVGVAYASGPVGSVPPPQYPNWGCTGTCNSANGDWSLTAGSSMVTNVASLYANENVVIDVNDLVVPSNSCIDITVDTLHICTSANGLYPWTFSNVSGSYHQVQIFCSTSCQGNYLVSVLPISAPSPTPTPNPSFTATPTPVIPPTVTPPSVPRITHTPTVSPTPCVINAWGCDQPATATYVACESGAVVNYGSDPCAPTATTTAAPTSTAVPTPPSGGCAPADNGVLKNANFCGYSYWTFNNYYGFGELVRTDPGKGDSLYGWENGAYWPEIGGTSDGFAAHEGAYDQYIISPGVPAQLIYHSTGYVLYGTASTAQLGCFDVTASVACGSPIAYQSGAQNFGTIPAGHEVKITVYCNDYSVGKLGDLNWYDASLTPIPPATNTAGPTGTVAPTWTPRPTFTRTPVVPPTNTPIGFVAPTATILANIDTCLGTIQDCNLALTPIAGKIGGIPGLIATPMAPLNTSVFSPFQTIGITRGGCLSFGKLPVMIPHILWLASPVPVRGGPTATPNISGYVPISVTWTLPTVVGTPMRQGNFGPIDPLEFEPCNDPAIPTWGWDLSWNASTFFEWLGFFVWTIALIRRIFG